MPFWLGSWSKDSLHSILYYLKYVLTIVAAYRWETFERWRKSKKSDRKRYNLENRNRL
ncbi:hypothetical protein LEP1GSC192_2393 [Leptospira sp. B5-022]|nr:hypothetical protein LEP1GSC192_2393 [Leptospira sp. B5-022]